MDIHQWVPSSSKTPFAICALLFLFWTHLFEQKDDLIIPQESWYLIEITVVPQAWTSLHSGSKWSSRLEIGLRRVPITKRPLRPYSAGRNDISPTLLKTVGIFYASVSGWRLIYCVSTVGQWKKRNLNSSQVRQRRVYYWDAPSSVTISIRLVWETWVLSLVACLQWYSDCLPVKNST